MKQWRVWKTDQINRWRVSVQITVRRTDATAFSIVHSNEDSISKDINNELCRANQKSARGNVLCLDAADGGQAWPNRSVPPVGLEETAKNARNSQQPTQSDAESDAAGAQIDPGLQEIIDRWASLAKAVQADILAMTRAAT